MICPSCNTKNKDEAVYCRRCGKKLPVYVENDYDEDGYYEELEGDDGSLLTRILIAVTIVVVLMAVAVVIFVMVKNHTSRGGTVAESTTENAADDDVDEVYVFGDQDDKDESDAEEETADSENDYELGTTESSSGDADEDDDADDAGETPLAIAKRHKNLASKDPVGFEGHAYAVFDYDDVDLGRDFDACVEFCESLGGHMAVINSQEENDFIYDYVKKSNGESYAFFGYTDEGHEDDWRWVDGSSSGYENWWHYGSGDENQPNNRNGNEHYAQFYGKKKDGSWCDAKFGDGSHKFICEWE